MIWVLVIGLAWVAVAIPVALVIGRAIRFADQKRETERAGSGNFVVDRPVAPVVELRPERREQPEPAADERPGEGAWTGHPSFPSVPAVRAAGKPAVPPSPKAAGRDRPSPTGQNTSAVR